MVCLRCGRSDSKLVQGFQIKQEYCDHCTDFRAKLDEINLTNMEQSEEAKLEHVEPRNGWMHFPTHKPIHHGRYLVVTINGDNHRVLVSHWSHQRGELRFCVDELVWCFKPLPDDFPKPPNSLQFAQIDLDRDGAPRNRRAAGELRSWWRQPIAFNR